MAVKTLDAQGLRCPQPTIQVTLMGTKMKPGEVLEVIADCSMFEGDIRDWCARTQKELLWLENEGNTRRCRIQF